MYPLFDFRLHVAKDQYFAGLSNYRLCGHRLTWPQIQVFCIRNNSKMKQTSARKHYRTLFETCKQNCMQNLESFWQSSLLSKIPNSLFPLNPSIIIIDVFLTWKKKFSDIWQTVVLINMLCDSFTFPLYITTCMCVK